MTRHALNLCQHQSIDEEENEEEEEERLEEEEEEEGLFDNQKVTAGR